MATKILFVLAAALCGLAAVSASPARLLLDAELQLGHVDKSDVLNQFEIPNLENDELSFGINATKILEKIEEALKYVEERIELVGEEVESAVTSAVQAIEAAAESGAANWSNEVEKWVEKANETSIDVKVCLEADKQPLADVEAALKADAHQCLAERLETLNETLSDLQAAGPALLEVLKEGQTAVQECVQLGSVLSSLCLLKDLPAIQIKAATVVGEATVSASTAAAQAAALIPMTSLCTSVATAKSAVEVSGIVDTTIACIKEKIAT